MSKYRLYVSGSLIDIGSATIAQTYQINDLANIENRQCSFTNSFTVPDTPNNVKIFDMLGVPGNTSTAPYRKLPARLESESGFALMQNAYVQVKSTADGYKINLYDGTITLYDAIDEDSTLQDLDYSNINHVHSISNCIASFTNTEGYIHALYNTGTYLGVLTAIYVETWASLIFVHTLFKMIIEQAGFSYSGDLFSDEKFLNSVVSFSNGYDLPGDDEVDYAELMSDDVSQIDFVKDIMQRFGIMFRRDKFSKEVEFVKIETILNDFENAEDWSDKFASISEESYDLGSDYSQKNRFAYNYDSLSDFEDYATMAGFAPLDIHEGLSDGILEIDNENLSSEETTPVESIFSYAPICGYTEPKSSLFEFNGVPYITIPIFSIEETTDDDDETIEEITANETDIFIFDLVPASTENTEINICAGNILEYDEETTEYQTTSAYSYLEVPHYQDYLDNYYPSYNRILNCYKKITANIRLTDIDIYNLDFFKLKYIKHLGAYFYLNKVKEYKGEPTTKVELIEVKRA